MTNPTEPTLYEQVGGSEYFSRLVELFYEGVENDEVLRPMYPEDLEPGKAHLRDFLIQYFGGPGTYSDQRGHPRLRMRHAPFLVNEEARDHWFAHMANAVDKSGVGPENKLEMLEYFEGAATFMINSYE